MCRPSIPQEGIVSFPINKHANSRAIFRLSYAAGTELQRLLGSISHMAGGLFQSDFEPVVQPMTRTAIFVLLAVALRMAPLQAADWPQWRGPKRDGVALESRILMEWPDCGPTILWSQSLGIGASSMAVANGRLYTLGNRNDHDLVQCLDAHTGRMVWSYEYPSKFGPRQFEGGTASTPTIDEGRAYTLGEKGELFCFDAATGSIIWSKHLVRDLEGQAPRWGYAGSPLIVGNLLIVESGGKRGDLAAMNKRSGKVVWQIGSGDCAYSSPIPAYHGDQKVVLILNAYGLIEHRLSDGEVLWKTRWKTDWNINAATPIVSGSRIFVSSGYGTGGAVFDLARGTREAIWKSEEIATQFSSCVLRKGHLYGFHGNVGKSNRGSLRAVEFNTGKVSWSQEGMGVGTLILVGETLVMLSEDGELILAEANPVGYRERARMQVLGGRSWVAPAYSNGLLYCRNNSGRVVCIDLRNP